MIRACFLLCTLVFTAVAVSQTPPAAPKRTQWTIGQQVEIKAGPWWEQGTVTNKRTGDWYLITYKGGEKEWVEWWRLRKQGAKEDIARAEKNPAFKPGMNPPRPDAGDMPTDPDAAQASSPAQTSGVSKAAKAPKEVWDKPITDVDLKSIKTIELQFDGPWKVPVDSAAAPKPISTKMLPVDPGTGTAGLHAILRNGTTVAAVMRHGPEDDLSVQTLQRFDVAAGKAFPAIAFPRTSVPMAISPSGQRVFARETEASMKKPRRTDLWDVSGAEAKHIVSFVPDPKSMWGLKRAAFIDDDTLYTLDSDSNLIVWDVAKARPLWRAGVRVNASVEQSPTGKYLLAATTEGLFCFDARSGTILGVVKDAGLRALAVRPDGKQAFTGSAVVDLETGTVHPLAMSAAGLIHDHASYVSDQYLLASGRLIDLERQLVVWMYEPQPSVIAGVAMVATVDQRKPKLHFDQIPTAAERKKIEAVKFDEVMHVYPGAKVALDVKVQATLDEVKAVTDGVTAQLTKAGLVVDPAASMRVVCKTQDGPRAEHKWNVSGKIDPVHVMMTAKLSIISIERDGQVLWTTRMGNAPFTATLAPGETLQQHVDRVATFDLEWFGQVLIPRYIPKSGPQNGFGQSTWKSTGLQQQQ